jgi:hypothetical protein
MDQQAEIASTERSAAKNKLASCACVSGEKAKGDSFVKLSGRLQWWKNVTILSDSNLEKKYVERHPALAKSTLVVRVVLDNWNICRDEQMFQEILACKDWRKLLCVVFTKK